MIVIETARDFIYLLSGVYGQGTAAEPLQVVLNNDIDMNDENSMVNAGDVTWYMDFNGRGHTIRNFYYVDTTASFYLFYKVCGSIYDIKFKDIDINIAIPEGANGKLVLFGLDRGTNGNSFENVLISGRVQSLGGRSNNTTIFSNEGNNTIRGCSYRGSMKSDGAAYIFNGSAYGCTAVLTYFESTNVFVFSNNAILCAAHIEQIQGSEITVFGSESKYSYAVIKAANNICKINSSGQMLYDNDIATINNIVFSGGEGETTEHLKDVNYMAEVRGFPTYRHSGINELQLVTEHPSPDIRTRTYNMGFAELKWDWNIKNFELPLIPNNGAIAAPTVTFQIYGEPSTSITYNSTFIGSKEKYQHIDQSSAIVYGFSAPREDPSYPYYPYLFCATQGQRVRIIPHISAGATYGKLTGSPELFGGRMYTAGTDYWTSSAFTWDYTPLFSPNIIVNNYLTYGDILSAFERCNILIKQQDHWANSDVCFFNGGTPIPGKVGVFNFK